MNMVIVQIASVVTAFLSIFANALVCHVIVRLKTMKTSINYIILNLAVLEAISGVLGICYVLFTDNSGILGQPSLHEVYSKSHALVEVLCRIQRFYWVGVTYSPYLHVAMAYERYKAITKPLSRLNSAISKEKLRCILPLVWASGAGYIIFDAIIVTYNNKGKFCTDNDGYSWYEFKVYYVVFIVTQYIIPCIALFILYARLIAALRKQDIETGHQAEAERARRKAKKKVMWIVIVVTLSFYISCGVPYIFIVAYQVFDHYSEKIQYFQSLFVLFASLNAIFNPFIYFVFIESFRKGLKQILSRSQFCHWKLMKPMQISVDSFNSENIFTDAKKDDKRQLPQLLDIQRCANNPP